jgi:hypothetical protein
MAKKKENNKLAEIVQVTDIEQENVIFAKVAQIIEARRFNAKSTANSQVVLMFWEIGKYINTVILGTSRAEYGKKILSTVSTKLVANYGNLQFVFLPHYKCGYSVLPNCKFGRTGKVMYAARIAILAAK